VRHWSLTTVGVVVNLDQQVTQSVDLGFSSATCRSSPLSIMALQPIQTFVDEGPMVRGIVQAECYKVMYALFAHVAQGHRRAG
jgi:hypothetical protein